MVGVSEEVGPQLRLVREHGLRYKVYSDKGVLERELNLEESEAAARMIDEWDARKAQDVQKAYDDE